MILDKELLFSDKQTLAAGATSTNTIDTGPGDAGVGRGLDLSVMVSGAPATALTVTIEASGTADSGFAAVAAFTIPADQVKAGGRVVRNRLPEGLNRYVRLKYAGPASGAVTAGLVRDS